MEIKFKKLFKTTLLFFVVFVMIFNSFAAISVSDGSAFVTKAEFSADLNNLSNRMSALENSIDAKIDSLVSSYLSRNGIWNGEKQTIEHSSQNSLSYFYVAMGYSAINQKWSTNSSAASKTFYACTADERGSINGRSASNVYRPRADGDDTYTIIENITKSGLLCVNYNYFCGTGPAYDVANSRYRTDNTLGRSGWLNTLFSYGWSSALRWEFIETNQSGIKVGSSLFSVSQPFSNVSIVPDLDISAKTAYTDITTSFYAFVSKGNSLKIIGTIDNKSFVVNGQSSTSAGYLAIGLSGYDATYHQNFGTFSAITVPTAYVY